MRYYDQPSTTRTHGKPRLAAAGPHASKKSLVVGGGVRCTPVSSSQLVLLTYCNAALNL
jgi:hypothetical protein